MPKLRHYDNTGTARFVTFNCFHNETTLNNDRARDILIKYINYARNKHRFLLLGYVIMPEHLHLVLLPTDGMPLGRVVGEIKSLTAREWFRSNAPQLKGMQHAFWQKRCYDHNCRTPESVRGKIEYCHRNPVLRGLVRESKDWNWSSYNWYQGVRDVPLEMDKYEI